MADITLHSGSFCDRNNNEISITFFKKETTPQMTVEPMELSFTSGGGTKMLRVSNYTGTLSIRVPADWLSYTQSTSSGVRTYSLTATANTSTSVRSSTITLTDANNNPVTVEAVQAGTSSSISLSTSILSFGYGQETKTMTVTWSGGYTPTYSFPSWCTVTASGSTSPMTLTVTAAANTGDVRSAGVTFTNGISSANLQVTQQASATMYVLPNTLSFSSAGGSNTVTAYFTGSETLSYNIGGSGTGWLSGQAGTPSQGEQTFTFTAYQNSSTSVRSATITFTYGNITSQVTVDQAGSVPATISVDKSLIDFSANVGTDTVTVTYSGQGYVSASGGTSWLDVTYKDQPTPTTVRFDLIIDQNTGSSRSATITFTGSLGGTATTTVNQSAAAVPWSVNPSTINNVAYNGGTYNLTFTGTPSIGMGYEVDPYTADWVTANIQSLSAATVTVNANATTSQRSATVKFYKYDDHSTYVTVTVNQEGESLSVSPMSITYLPSGGTTGITATWTAGNEPTATITYVDGTGGWMTPTGSGTVTGNTKEWAWTASANNTGSSRTALITVSNGLQSEYVTVSQSSASAALYVTPSSMSFVSAGETKTAAVSNISGTLTTTKPSWITLAVSGSGSSRTVGVTAASNTLSTSRGGSVIFDDDRQSPVSMAVSQEGAAPTPSSWTIYPSRVDALRTAGGGFYVSISNAPSAGVSVSMIGVIGSWVGVNQLTSTGCLFGFSQNTSTSSRSAIARFIDQDDSSNYINLPITQNGTSLASISVTPVNMSFESSGGYHTATISNVDGDLSTTKPSWIRLSTTTPPYSSVIQMNITAISNATSAQRYGSVVFNDDRQNPVSIAVSQKSGNLNPLTATPSSISLDASGTDVTMSVDYEGTLSVSQYSDWLYVNPMTSSQGHNVYSVGARSNTSTNDRATNIYLSDDNDNIQVLVYQEGRVESTLTVSPTSIAASPSLSTYTETITYPSEYGVSGSVNYVNGSNWITLNWQPVTSNTRTVNVIIEGNNSGSGRAAQIVFTGNNGGTGTVDVYQSSN